MPDNELRPIDGQGDRAPVNLAQGQTRPQCVPGDRAAPLHLCQQHPDRRELNSGPPPQRGATKRATSPPKPKDATDKTPAIA